ncbi:MAG: PhoU domain-containing protein [Promethearchaeota archaeon]
MEQRKIIQLGKSSLVISLPKEWINRTRLKQGDFISLSMENDGSLRLSPIRTEERIQKKIELQIQPNEEKGSLIRSIIGSYLNGYTDINLVAKGSFSTSQHMSIRKIAHRLYIRILEADSKHIYMTVFGDESNIEFTSYIKRMYKISYSMVKDAFEALLNKDLTLARNIYTLSEDVDHFYIFLIRLLRRTALDPSMCKKINIAPLDCQDFTLLINRINHVANHAATIAKQLISLEGKKLVIPDKILKTIYEAGKLATKMYEEAFKAFFDENRDNANAVIKKEKEIDDYIISIASQTFTTKDINVMTVCALCSIRDILKRVSDRAVAIAEHAITRSFARDK